MSRKLIVAVIGAVLAVWFLIGFLADRSVQKAVSRDAVDKAANWGVYMSAHIPDIETLVQNGLPTPQQKDAIRQIRQLGDVFRFKLFDDTGRLVLVSDEDLISNPAEIGPELDPEPVEVLRTGIEIVSVYDGSQKSDRPDIYAEAYIPLIHADGTIFGVAEVYVDETLARSYFIDSFKDFGLAVSAFCAVLFLVPALAYGAQRSLTERTRSEVDYLTKFDALTGLFNRPEFTRRANALIEKREVGAVLFLDADRLKVINDSYGHAAGDKYIEHIGRNLAACTEADDLAARFGGDEFVVALSDSSCENVMRRVRKILTLCAQTPEIGDRKITGSVSIGVSIPEPGVALDQVLAQADAALYFAKSAGRNQYALYGDDMGAEIKRRNELERCVLDAAENNGFSLDYQPLVSSGDFVPVGYEALMRLRLADGRSIPPSEFIPLAEELGLIDKIGASALFQATRDVARLPGTPKVAINLSVAQFRSGRLPQLVVEALLSSGLPAERLELEITESLLLDDDESVALQIDAIQELGVCIAMDDFGTGFSSLGYLWKYGFDRIKIDQSFVAGLSDNSDRSLEIIESVVLLGKRLGMQITAEGVETQQQSEILSRLGCDVLQGYFFGSPSALEVGDGGEERDSALSA